MTLVHQLRVHGVGGRTAPECSGSSRVRRDSSAKEPAARPSWPAETTGASRATTGATSPPARACCRLWVVPLPFTLINLAGGMHPPVPRASQGRVQGIRAGPRLSGLLTTTYVFRFAIILVELLG